MSPRMIDNSRWEWPSIPHPPSYILPNIIDSHTTIKNNYIHTQIHVRVARLEHYGEY